jgi:hypothetical protein
VHVVTHPIAHSIELSPLDVEFSLFDPSLLPPPDHALIFKLDGVLNAGIAKDDFEALFIQCEKCHAILLCQNIVYHDCMKAMPGGQEVHSADEDRKYLLYGIESSGLSMDRFEALFSYCGSCSKYMTSNTSRFHDCLLWDRLETYSQ